MVSIFKAVWQNDVEVIRYLVDLGSGVRSATMVPKEDQRRLVQYLKSTGQKSYNLNRRSIKGRTALHCAIAWNRVDIARILIESSLVNVNLQDRESGWTPLHSALYLGNIEIAIMLTHRDDLDYTVKDWDGFRPLELLGTTMDDMAPIATSLITEEDVKVTEDERLPNRKKMTYVGGTDVYSWGVNTNYVLGHPDSENRTYPERVPLDLESQRNPYIMKRPNYVIQSMHLSKYHMAIITSERINNLLVCGFGRGGRLGTGERSDAQLTLVPVPWSERIIAVALGRDHTVAVTESGSVITFGSNKFGQLGYEIERPTDDPVQFSPRRVQAPALKKQQIIGAAASRIHSVVYTLTDIFTFGRNEGQLGYHHSGDDIHQVTPRKVAFPTEILQVVAIESATVVLLKSYDVLVLSNFTQHKISFPMTRFASNMQVHRSLNSHVEKLFAGDSDQWGAISSTGDIYLCSMKSISRQSEMGNGRQRKKPMEGYIHPPKRIWTLTKPHLAARDACIGQNGEIILCTESGNVFTGAPLKDINEGNYKFTLIPHLHRCIRVRANASGAFMALRTEYKAPMPSVRPSTLTKDLELSLPHLRAMRLYQPDYRGSTMHDGKCIRKGVEEEDHHDDNSAMLSSEDKLQGSLGCIWKHAELLSENDDTLDVSFLVQGRRLYCHLNILCSRSSNFERILDGTIQDPHLLVTKWASRIEIDVKQCHLEAFLLFLDYLYTDKYCHPMDAFYRPPFLCQEQTLAVMPASVQKDLLMLAQSFGLPLLYDSALSSFSHKPRPSLVVDMERLCHETKGADTKLILKGGDLLCHEVIVRQRCPFFEKLLCPSSVWVEDRKQARKRANASNYIEIHMNHIHKETMELILRYLYTDQDDTRLFNDIKKQSTEEMIHYFLDILCVAEELLLHRLKNLCERALTKFIALRTAIPLLEWADMYLAEQLKTGCLSFIAANLPTYLFSGAFLSKEALIHDLEMYIRQRQAEKAPYVRREEAWNPHSDFPLDIQDEEFSTSLYTLSREDKPVITKYTDQLVTLYPKQKNGYTAETPSREEVGKAELSREKPSNQRHETKSFVDINDQHREKKDEAASSIDIKEPVPRNGRQASWVESLASGSAQYEKPSLRQILEEEPRQSKKALESSITGKISNPYIPKKISQKERRKLQQQEMASILAAVSTPKPIWGKPVAVESSMDKIKTAEPPRLKIEDRSISSPQISTSSFDENHKGKKVYVSKSFFDKPSISERHPDDNLAMNVFDPFRSIGPTFSMTPARRSSRQRAAGGKDPCTEISRVQSFHSIQQQQEIEDNWIKGKRHKKSLVQIQTEEKAIEGLSEYYLQTIETGSGEWFEIIRKEKF
ncbi:hypothetical protein EC973_003149 [Apophysomyces ossiformis]|uniref:BTB domain-containing protein n=1 Tax=Apophysomyces ossiformis TaxID=679940 RepID=A0A8H7BHG0_9FUNG|nr:hypothetical protein EC973_003149 [Apophysomyces ossiformis]